MGAQGCGCAGSYADAVMGSGMYAVVAVFSPTEGASSELIDLSATESADGHIFVACEDRIRGVGHMASSRVSGCIERRDVLCVFESPATPYIDGYDAEDDHDHDHNELRTFPERNRLGYYIECALKTI